MTNMTPISATFPRVLIGPRDPQVFDHRSEGDHEVASRAVLGLWYLMRPGQQMAVPLDSINHQSVRALLSETLPNHWYKTRTQGDYLFISREA